jgi:oligosaccharide repeat unit polymerase
MVLFKRNWKFVLITLFLLLYFSLGGGRLGYLRMIFGLVFVFYCLFNGEKIKIGGVVVIGIVLFVFLHIVSIVTMARGGSAQSASESGYIAFIHYLCGPMSAFDYAIHSDYIDRMGGYTYGRLTLSTLDGWMQYLFQAFGVHYETALQTLTEFKQGVRIAIGPRSTWNALYTSQLFTWLDFGYIGCIFLPLFFGIGVKWIVNLFYKYRNWPFFVLVSAFFQISMDSTIDYRFTSPFTLLAFLILFYLGKKSVNKHVTF